MITNTINTISLDTEGKCNTCGFWSSHSNDFPKHKTCLCRLVGERGICCLEGYKTLINDVPNLGFVVPFPLAFNKEMKAASHHNTEKRIQRTKQYDTDFKNSCQEIRRLACLRTSDCEAFEILHID